MVLGLGIATILLAVTRVAEQVAGAARLTLAIVGIIAACFGPADVVRRGTPSAPRSGRLPFVLDIFLGALVACLLAVLVGVGAPAR